MTRAVLAILLVATPLVSRAASLRVSATLDPPRVGPGESSDLAVVVEGSQSAPTPDLGDTHGLSLAYVGPASQMSFVNGRVSTSVTHHYTVVGGTPGRFAIGPITVTVDGTRYDAGTVTLEVAAAGGAGAAATGTDQLTLTLGLPRTQIYVGERVPVTVRLTVGAVRVTNVQYPIVAGDGYATEKFPEPSQRRESGAQGTVQVVGFATTLTALKAGALTVGPATMSLSVVAPSRRRSPFFGGFFDDETRTVELRSAPVVLTALPLPAEGRPADFSGAVGRFDFAVTAQPTEIAVGDPVTVRSVLRGDGGLAGVAPPAVAASDLFRVYPPQASAPGAESGARSFEQVVIPLREGSLALPVPAFSYFDPAARAYRRIAPAPIALTVRPSPLARATPEIVGGAASATPRVERPATLGRDIVFIKDAPGTLRPLGGAGLPGPVFWMLQLVPALGCGLALAWARRRDRLAGDLRYARFTRAGREARRELAQARAALARGDTAAGHDAVAAALRDYLAAKLGLPPGAVAESAPGRLRAVVVGDGTADVVRDFFAACEAARFAPAGPSPGDLERAIAQAERIVRALERTRRLAPAAAALLLLTFAGLAAAATESASALFIRANGLYGDGRYADAAGTYEQILAGGVASGPVLYNLGNAYLKAGDVGRAVLAYERALRWMPADPDLRANLSFARERAGDVEEEPLVRRLVLPLADRATTATLAVAAAGVWWLLLGALAAAALRPAFARAARVTAIVAAGALVVTGSSAFARWWTVDTPAFAVLVGADDVPVRAEPSPTGTALFTARPGTLLRVDRTRESWAQVASRDGRRGWLPAADVVSIVPGSR